VKGVIERDGKDAAAHCRRNESGAPFCGNDQAPIRRGMRWQGQTVRQCDAEARTTRPDCIQPWAALQYRCKRIGRAAATGEVGHRESVPVAACRRRAIALIRRNEFDFSMIRSGRGVFSTPSAIYRFPFARQIASQLEMLIANNGNCTQYTN
jgi:hypothetical protein